MCGIFGLVGRVAVPDANLVDRLTDLVAHRGPDGRGTVVRGNAALGHRRLSIIDLSDDGRQPMWHHAAPVCITYNGEVYNYVELRQELECLGHAFRSHSDTEVILAAYLQWGPACVQRFNGMWSFAIMDELRKTIFCSRDRFGVKPFYWLETSQLFAFGSEIPQLLPLCERATAVSQIVRDYIVSGLSDHSDATFFAGVRKLPAGHNLTYDLAHHTYRIERYYDFRPADPTPVNVVEAASAFQALLTDAVKLRLRSDVRVGTCLSGGLDSSSIATTAAMLRGPGAGPFAAITAVSEQEENSEERYAGRVVAAANLDWVRIRPGYAEFAGAIGDVIATQAEPFGGPSVCMQYFVMEAARAAGVTVLLDGQGGDEALSGYERHYATWLRSRLRQGGLPGLRRSVSSALQHNQNLSRTALFGMALGSMWPSLIERSMRPAIPGARFEQALPIAWRDYLRQLADSRSVQSADVYQTSLPMLLRFEDRNSMRHAVEARLPFLDYRLMEFSLGLSIELKMREGWTKWPLRYAMQDVLPADIVWRKNKLGFEAPDRTWLARFQGDMLSMVRRSRILGELFNRRRLEASYPRLERNLAWRLYCLAAWESRFDVTDIA